MIGRSDLIRWIGTVFFRALCQATLAALSPSQCQSLGAAATHAWCQCRSSIRQSCRGCDRAEARSRRGSLAVTRGEAAEAEVDATSAADSQLDRSLRVASGGRGPPWAP